MAVSFQSLKPRYRQLWDTMTINSGAVDDADRVARKILANKDRYVAIERQTGVPWFYIGLVHNRESDCNFNTYLGNGQPLNRVTTIVPKGRGPFPTFEAGAIDALEAQNLIGVPDWSLEHIAFLLEAFNGFGYQAKGINSPYLWAGSNQYTSGKFVADHVFRPDVVDTQLGSMVVLTRLAAMDADVKARVGAGTGVVTADGGILARGSSGDRVRQLQNALAQGGFDVGEIDGRFGPKTSAAVRAFQSAHSLPATGIADQATQAALKVAEQPVQPPAHQSEMLKDLFGILLGRLRPPGAPVTPTEPKPASTQPDASNTLALIVAALLGRQPPTSPGALVPPPKVLSPIDKVLGGEALAGKKTALSIVAYAIVAILKAAGVAGLATTPAGPIITALIGGFGALGGVAKIDRVIQTLGLIAARPR